MWSPWTGRVQDRAPTLANNILVRPNALFALRDLDDDNLPAVLERIWGSPAGEDDNNHHFGLP